MACGDDNSSTMIAMHDAREGGGTILCEIVRMAVGIVVGTIPGNTL